ncbi:hypothetical protein [Secundilactobacillus kimchicus]|uniref:hypothetical protein n=1 Tax=Secundilactobacillus kimchicus TaxID=528209 RepID=UPI0024A94334|nr:hypothetical protein [Secundilactobacillus kimchicus]
MSGKVGRPLKPKELSTISGGKQRGGFGGKVRGLFGSLASKQPSKKAKIIN